MFFSGIPECVAHNTSEATVAPMLVDNDVAVDFNSIEAYHRAG